MNEGDTSSRLAQLADRLDYFTEADLMLLADVTPGTLESWRRQGNGPAYVRAGNRFFYPKAGVMQWLSGRVKERDWTSVRESL